MATQNEDFKKKVQELENQLRKTNGEANNKIDILKQECERLNSLI